MAKDKITRGGPCQFVLFFPKVCGYPADWRVHWPCSRHRKAGVYCNTQHCHEYHGLPAAKPAAKRGTR